MVILAGAYILYTYKNGCKAGSIWKKKTKKWRKEHERYFNETIT